MIARNQDVATDAPAVDSTSAEPPAGAYLTRDQIFHLLQNERRRLALVYLRDADGPVEMRAIAEQVAAWEHGTTVAALDSDQRQRVYIPLYQNHLPKLDEEGVIDYDQSRGVVERTAAADQLDPYLDGQDATDTVPPRAAPETDPWPRYYLATALAGVGLLGAVAVGAPFLDRVPALAVGAVVVLAFAALSLAQTAGPQVLAGSR